MQCMQMQLRMPENASLQRLATALVHDKTATQLLTFTLQTLTADTADVLWLCGELEANLWAANSSPVQLQQCVSFERAAGKRLELFGAQNSPTR